MCKLYTFYLVSEISVILVPKAEKKSPSVAV